MDKIYLIFLSFLSFIFVFLLLFFLSWSSSVFLYLPIHSSVAIISANLFHRHCVNRKKKLSKNIHFKRQDKSDKNARESPLLYSRRWCCCCFFYCYSWKIYSWGRQLLHYNIKLNILHKTIIRKMKKKMFRCWDFYWGGRASHVRLNLHNNNHIELQIKK